MITTTDSAPYPGLRPFERDESHLFFGRDSCVDAMVARLSATRFLAVLGSSGTGKSSLVKTGFLSGLEMGLVSGRGSRWRIVDFRPSGSPIRNLAAGLLRTDPATKSPADPAAVEALRARLAEGGPRALIEWCREGHLEAGTNLLLLVDQFEELFRYQDYAGREEAEAFVALLLESRKPLEADTPQEAEFPIFVVTTMRSEYLGACALIEGLAETINEGTYLTPRMSRTECQEAIIGPARVCGFDVEPLLVNRLLNDLANFAPWTEDRQGADQLSLLARRADQLPLMQHALNQMWLRAVAARKPGEKIMLREVEYRGLERELDDHAHTILTSLGDERRGVVETVFRAVTEGTTVANAVRRPTRYGDLVALCGDAREDVVTVVTAFAAPGAHFLTGVPAGGTPADESFIDISHESLIRQWKDLSKWLEQEGRTAHEWQRVAEDAERGELLAGRRLSNALALDAETTPALAWGNRYGLDIARIRSYLQKSARARNARRFVYASVSAVVVGGIVAVASWGYSQERQSKVFRQTTLEFGTIVEQLAQKSLEEYQKQIRELSAKLAQRGENEVRAAQTSSPEAGGTRPRDRKPPEKAPSLNESSADDAAYQQSAEWQAWHEKYRLAAGLVENIEGLLTRARKDEELNAALIRQHMTTLAFLSVLQDNPFGDAAKRQRAQAFDLASQLARLDLDFENVRGIRTSLKLLHSAMMADQQMAGRFTDALGALDHLIAVLEGFDRNIRKTDEQRREVSSWLGETLLDRCDVLRQDGNLDAAIGSCARGAKLIADDSFANVQRVYAVINDLAKALSAGVKTSRFANARAPRLNDAVQILTVAAAPLRQFADRDGTKADNKVRANKFLTSMLASKCEYLRKDNRLDDAIKACTEGLDRTPPWTAQSDLHAERSRAESQIVAAAKTDAERQHARAEATKDMRRAIDLMYAQAGPDDPTRQPEQLVPDGVAQLDGTTASGEHLAQSLVDSWLSESDVSFALRRGNLLANRLDELEDLYEAGNAAAEARAVYVRQSLYRLALVRAFDRIPVLRAQADELNLKLGQAIPEERAALSKQVKAANDRIEAIRKLDQDAARRLLSYTQRYLAYLSEGVTGTDPTLVTRLFADCEALMAPLADREPADPRNKDALGLCIRGTGWLEARKAVRETDSGKKIEHLTRSRAEYLKAAHIFESIADVAFEPNSPIPEAALRLATSFELAAERQSDVALERHSIADLDGAIEDGEKGLIYRQRIFDALKTDAERDNLAMRYSVHAWFQLLAGHAEDALKNAGKAVDLRPSAVSNTITPDDLTLAVNYAHALLFTGQEERARAIYAAVKDKTFDQAGGQTSGRQAVEGDFADLRAFGTARPVMCEIGRLVGDPFYRECKADN